MLVTKEFLVPFDFQWIPSIVFFYQHSLKYLLFSSTEKQQQHDRVNDNRIYIFFKELSL